jgi:hypothetical protein
MLSALFNALGADELAQRMTEGSAWSADRALAEAMLV